MSRNALHLVVDIALFVSLLGLVLTGLLMAFVLPPRSGALAVWGSTRHDWGGIHFWLAMTLLGIAVVHLSLNWGWVCNVAVRLGGQKPDASARKRRNLAGGMLVAVVALVVSVFLWAASASVERGAAPGSGQRLDGGEGGGGGGMGRGFRGGAGPSN